MLKKPRPRLLTTAFSILAGLVLVLNACGAPSGPANGPSGGGTAVKGGTWIDDLYEEPDSLLPNASNETFAAMVMYGLYAPLVYGDTSGKLQPGIATQVPSIANGGASADAKTFTFHLRSGLQWSDGMPLNADDVDFTWKLWKNSKFGAINTVGIQLIQSADVSSDKLSITFHLSRGFSPFVTNWADGYYAPLPMHHFASMPPESIVKSPDNLNPSVTSGPFMMAESKPGDHYTIQRNPKYYLASQGYPYLDKVVFRIVSDQNTILKDLQAGTIDSSWFLDVTKVPAYKRLTDYTLNYNNNSTNFEAMWLNFNNKVIANNPEVRQAMAMSVDQQSLIDTARRGIAAPLCTDHSPAVHPGYQPDAPCPKFDTAAAGNLLESHGWVKGSDGVRSKNGQRLEFQYSTTAGNLWRQDDELINQSNFKKAGIKLDIQNYPASTFFGTFLFDGKPGKYDIAEYATSSSYDPDDAALFACNQIPPNGGNTDFYCNHQLDQLYLQEQGTADPNQRQQIFNQIHQIYLTDFPFIVLFSPPDLAMSKRGTHNYAPSPVGVGETENIWQWWCDNGKCPA